MNLQTDLFQNNSNPNLPLAEKYRPKKFDKFFGHQDVLESYPFLKNYSGESLVIWGPPGSGKTTLAKIISQNSGYEIYLFSAVTGGVGDLRKLIEQTIEMRKMMGQKAVIFIDEIHRFNKSQQDTLLPWIESGEISLLGATTENPKISLNRALLSRLRIVEFKKLSESDLKNIIQYIAQEENFNLQPEILDLISDRSEGDARKAINLLDFVIKHGKNLSFQDLETKVITYSRHYDRDADRHYDVISAFIKSMRGSDVNAAIYWLAVMIDGDEDPVFISRRMLIFASEDIGNADPFALVLAQSCLDAVKNIGYPEARIILSQTASYLALTDKSNSSYLAIDEALSYVREQKTAEVPGHLRSLNKTETYLYPHDYPNHYVKQRYTIKPLPGFYKFSEQGRESILKKKDQAREK
jgi:putative ATPase